MRNILMAFVVCLAVSPVPPLFAATVEDDVLRQALAAGERDKIDFWLEAGALDLSQRQLIDGVSPVRIVLEGAILDRDAGLQFRVRSPQAFAIDMLELLRASGHSLTNLDGTTIGTRTPLQAAVLEKRYRLAEYLVRETDSDPVQPMSGTNGQTVLHRLARGTPPAERDGALSLLSAVAAGGADLDVRNAYGETPVHTAAANLSFAEARILLDAGADANAVDNAGQTALWHIGQESPSPSGKKMAEMAELLAAQGADPTRDRDDGLDLIAAALQAGNKANYEFWSALAAESGFAN